MKKSGNRIILWVTIVVFVVALLGFLMTLLAYSPYWFGLDKRTFYTSVNFSSGDVGFDVNGTALTFGMLKLGGSANRNIIFSNSYDFPVVLQISLEGSISPYMKYEPSVYVDKNETKKISFSVVSPWNADVGHYDGYVKFKIVPAA